MHSYGKLGTTIQEPSRVWKTDKLVVFYLIVLYSVMYTKLVTSLLVLRHYAHIFLFLLSWCFWRRYGPVLLIFVDTYHLNYTLLHAHMYVHTHTSAHVWLAQRRNGEKQAHEPSSKGREMGLFETKAWHTHKYFKKKKSQYTEISNLKKLEQIELPAKLLDYFLWVIQATRMNGSFWRIYSCISAFCLDEGGC